MKKKCSICNKVSCGHSYRESFVCEECLDYIRGLNASRTSPGEL